MGRPVVTHSDTAKAPAAKTRKLGTSVQTDAEATAEPPSDLARTRISHVPQTMEGNQVNATEAMKSFSAGYEFDALSNFKTVAEKASLGLEGSAEATLAAIQGAEQAFELQTQFVRKALDAYGANLNEMSALFSSTLSATLKPLSAFSAGR
jgi:hypothetical protein